MENNEIQEDLSQGIRQRSRSAGRALWQLPNFRETEIRLLLARGYRRNTEIKTIVSESFFWSPVDVISDGVKQIVIASQKTGAFVGVQKSMYNETYRVLPINVATIDDAVSVLESLTPSVEP